MRKQRLSCKKNDAALLDFVWLPGACTMATPSGITVKLPGTLPAAMQPLPLATVPLDIPGHRE